MRIAQLFLAAALSAAATPSLAQDYEAGPIRIERPWSRATPPNARVAGGYMRLENGGADDRLTALSSPAAGRVEVHRMDVENGVMTMRPLPDGLELPAGGEVTLAPGGLHLMLVDLRRPLAEGERVPLRLTFAKAGSVDVELAVEALGAKGATGDDHAGHGGHGTHGGGETAR